MTDQHVKDAVRDRDGHRCTECGMTAAEHFRLTGKTLQVHRLAPGSRYTIEGCVTLCKRCHGPKPRSPWCSRPALTHDEYQQLQALADKNNRPLLWQLRMILHEALRAEGLWPPPAPEKEP